MFKMGWQEALIPTATCPDWTGKAPIQAMMASGLRRDVLCSARLEHIFHLYTRPDRASTAERKRTGVSLSQVQDLNFLPIIWYIAFDNSKSRMCIDAVPKTCPSNRHRQSSLALCICRCRSIGELGTFLASVGVLPRVLVGKKFELTLENSSGWYI